MAKFIFSFLILLSCTLARAQGIELFDFQSQQNAGIGESINIPLKIKNTGEKAVNLVILEISRTLGTSQKHNFCLDNNCLESGIKEFHKRLEPGEILSNLVVQVEAGLLPGQSSIHYRVFNQNNPNEFTEIELQILVEEKIAKNVLYKTNKITVNEIYPNPVTDHGFVDYQIHKDGITANILLHNVLGSIIAEYPLSVYENRVKLKTDDLSPGIYFLTLYIDNENVLTRKLIVRK